MIHDIERAERPYVTRDATRLDGLATAVKDEKAVIDSVLNDLHDATEYLSELINELSERVKPVSTQYDEGESPEAETTGRGSSRVYYSLEALLQTAYRQQRAINIIRNKLEI